MERENLGCYYQRPGQAHFRPKAETVDNHQSRQLQVRCPILSVRPTLRCYHSLLRFRSRSQQRFSSRRVHRYCLRQGDDLWQS